MFSLIISIIAIALVAALAGASVYYGGSAFNKGTAGADASTFKNGGQQVNGAMALAKADGKDVDAITALTDLSDGTLTEVYLSQVPTYKSASYTLGTNYINVEVTGDVCAEVAGVADSSAVTAYTGAAYAETDDASGLFGCAGSTANGFNAFYQVR